MKGVNKLAAKTVDFTPVEELVAGLAP